ncbi:hypothetical protein BAUCODRAFT_134676 [Baudoinia panamericana UAMH 10762]|uniref:Peptidase A1 domain-containing protein n=1 Tax=Baudoinia panamericana (strain UAMH 10762) TaxID=717646 RepID=M2M5L1_BAUPA|nr:uncharacterized protein BAUCODRAFT_134676 [Baudoinia panamericana UAMH 10762]EMC91921.1 hypothetical protein BAUCODRAFT_134676 [Baudoinia panamericana UAMH 10762]
MFVTSFLAAGWLMQGIVATPLPFTERDALIERPSFEFHRRDPVTKRDATPLETSSHILPIQGTSIQAQGSSALQRFVRAASNVTTPLISAERGGGYAIQIDFGGTTFEVVFDTGSSDLWLAETGVQCVNANGRSVTVAQCGFGPLADSTFEGGSIANENFNISYGDGEFLIGTLGHEDVSIAGITVPNQEVALVNEAYWVGDNVTSGLMGFAFPSLTSAFPGINPALDNPNNTVPYTNWIFNAIEQGLIDPMFSLAIERGTNGGGGQLALGGLPTIPFDQTFTSTPLQIVDLTDDANAAQNFSFYTIVPDGFLLSGQQQTYRGYRNVSESPATNYDAIVDSGTTLMYLPNNIAQAVNALFDPPSVYIEEEGVFENYCDATPPTFAIRINGTDFYINSAEMLLTGAGGQDTYTGGCITGVQPGFGGPYILGDTFLKNVVAVYDIGASEMRFAPHENH